MKSTINVKSESKNWRLPDSDQPKVEDVVIQEDEFSCILPASPNWYCNKIVSCLNGFCAFGGKNSIFLFDLKSDPPVCRWSHPGLSFNGKISSIVLMCIENTTEDVDFVALGAEDGMLKILNIKNKTLYKDIMKHKGKVMGVCWSPLTPKTLVSGDEKGCVLVWNFDEKICNIWTPLESSNLSCISLSPYLLARVLIGYANGNIIVGDTQKLEVLHNLKSHSHEICSLSWKPLTEIDTKEGLFVSGSKDRTIRVWDGVGGKQVVSYTLPKTINGTKHQVMKTKIFNSVQWLNDSQILSGYHSGEILAWDTSNGKWKVISNGHYRLVFAMCKDNLTDYFVSVSMDRQVIFYKSSAMSTAHKLPTFGGFVYSATVTSNNSNKLALGVGDNTIRLWTTGVDGKPYENVTIWQGLKSKVTALLYHPTKEGILGFGTEDGHVGCFSSISQKFDVSVTYHKKTVYSLSWGPCCCDKEPEEKDGRANCLFSVGGEGVVYMHKMGAFNQKALGICQFIKQTNKLSTVPLRSDVAWHSGLEYVAIGNEDGTIDILRSRKLLLVCRIQVYKKVINTLAWHHDFNSSDKETCYSYWLACGSNEESVRVFDLQCLQSASEEDVLTIDQPHHELLGHRERITKVSWSPYKSGILASCSYDGTVQVWDVNKNEGLANYRDHIGRVHCVTWSYSHPDVLYSGGEDFCLHRWKYTELADKLPPTGTKKKTKSRKKKKDEQPQQQPKVTEEVEFKETVVSSTPSTQSKKQEVQKQKILEPTRNVETVTPEISEIQFVDKSQLSNKKTKRLKASLLKKSQLADRKKKELMQEDCINLALYLNGAQEKKINNDNNNNNKCTDIEKSAITPGSEEWVNLGLYTSRKDLLQMISTECSGHLENKNYSNAIQLELWRSNIGGAIDIAIKNGALDGTLVAMSPLGGYDLWRATMFAYAEQLEKQKLFTTAASFYIGAGDVHRAIEMFRSENMLKEALIIAKAQLSKDDPLLRELYLSLAKKLIFEHSYENAAECYLACGYVEEAIAMLSKRNDADSFLTALKVADIYALDNKSAELLPRAINALLHENRWKLCHKVMRRLDALQMCHLKAVVSELVLEHFIKMNSQLLLNNNNNHMAERHFTDQEIGYPSYVHKTDKKATPFLFSCLSILESEYKISPSTTSNFSLLIDESRKPQKQDSTFHLEKMLQALVSHLLHGILHLLQGNINSCFKAWLAGCHTLTRGGCQVLMESFHAMLFPQGKVSFDFIASNFHNLKTNGLVHSSLFTNFVAYCFHGELYTKWWAHSERLSLVSETIVSKRNSESSEIRNVVISTENNKHTLHQTLHGESRLNSYVNYTSSVLLNSSYALSFQLKDKLEKLDTDLLELDIKKRLRDHLQTKQLAKGSKLKTEDEVMTVINLLMDNVLEEEEKIKRKDLLQEKEKLMQLLDTLPDDIKDCHYPHPKDSLPVLLLLCCLSHDTDGSMRKRCNELIEWGKSFGVYEPHRYIEMVVQRFNSN